MKKIRKIFGLGILSLAALACTKVGPEAVSDEQIAVGAEVAQTKALIDGEFQNNSVITVYDWLDADGTTNDKYLMDGVYAQYKGEEAWTYVQLANSLWSPSGAQYHWEEGSHKFFGWLEWDGSMKDTDDSYLTPAKFFGDGFGLSNQKLTIPEKTMNQTTPQFDFVYSDVKTVQYRKGNNPGRIDLEMNHLFTAVCIGVENSTSSIVTIEDFRVENIPTTRSAQIDYSGESAAEVSYYDWKDDDTMTRGLDEGIDPYGIAPGGLRSNIFDGSLTTKQEYMMLWPIEANHLHSTDKEEILEGGEVKYPDTWKMYIKYTIDGKPYEKRINFPNTSWEAGKKNQLTIVFADKMVDLKVQVKDWEYETQNINYMNESPSISSGGALAWNSTISAVDTEKKMVSIVNAQPAKAEFTLQTPIGGSWIVSLVGDVNAFEVSPSTGIIDSQTATIHVRPLVSSPTRDYKVQLKFTVRRSDGRMIAADNIIQSNGIYTVVLPRNN